MTANSVCSRSAAQNVGIEYSAKRTAPEVRSKAPSGLPPATTPSGIASSSAKNEGEAVQRERVRQRFEDPLGDRPVVHERLAEVEPHDPAHPRGELRGQRPIEAVLPPHLFGRLPAHATQRIGTAPARRARREVQQEEDDHGDAEEGRHGPEETPQDVRGHGAAPVSGAAHHASGPGQIP